MRTIPALLRHCAPTLCALIVLATAAVIGQPATAANAENSATESTQDVAQKPPPNKRVCKKVRTTGSRIPQKICMRQRQWDDITDRSQRTAQEMRDSAEFN